MEDIVFMRLLFVAGLLGLLAAVVLVSHAIVGLRRWLGTRRADVPRAAVAGRSAR